MHGNVCVCDYIAQSAIPSALNTKELTPFDVPFYWTNVANTPSLHWDYPDVNVAKALGGCGIHNAMLYGEILCYRAVLLVVTARCVYPLSVWLDRAY